MAKKLEIKPRKEEDLAIACGAKNLPIPKTKCRKEKGKDIIEIP